MTRQGLLNIGLTYYQERQWVTAIKHYGAIIMEKSLLTKAQKEALIQAQIEDSGPNRGAVGESITP